MAKLTISKAMVPILKKDLELEVAEIKKIKDAQDAFNKEFSIRIDQGKLEALEKYTALIESLKKAKQEMTRDYNLEIKRYQDLVELLKNPPEGE